MNMKTHILLKSIIATLMILSLLLLLNSCKPVPAEVNEVEAKTEDSIDEEEVNGVEAKTEDSIDEEKVINFEVSTIELGFNPDPDLIDISNEVDFPDIPQNLEPYRGFIDVEGVWGEPRAGYNFGYNDAFRDVTRRANVQIPTWKWLVFTGEETWLPGIGSVKDLDGGAILVALINVWEFPGEFLNAYLLHGFWAVGEVWNMSDMIDNKDYTNPEYGEYTLETLAALRNHYLNQLGSDEPNPEFRGQCGCAEQCDTITWVVVLRWYDGSFRLVDSGQWISNS